MDEKINNYIPFTIRKKTLVNQEPILDNIQDENNTEKYTCIGNVDESQYSDSQYGTVIRQFIDENDTVNTIQNIIAYETDIPIANQLLYGSYQYNNQPIKYICLTHGLIKNNSFQDIENWTREYDELRYYKDTLLYSVFLEQSNIEKNIIDTENFKINREIVLFDKELFTNQYWEEKQNLFFPHYEQVSQNIDLAEHFQIKDKLYTNKPFYQSDKNKKDIPFYKYTYNLFQYIDLKELFVNLNEISENIPIIFKRLYDKNKLQNLYIINKDKVSQQNLQKWIQNTESHTIDCTGKKIIKKTKSSYDLHFIIQMPNEFIRPDGKKEIVYLYIYLKPSGEITYQVFNTFKLRELRENTFEFIQGTIDKFHDTLHKKFINIQPILNKIYLHTTYTIYSTTHLFYLKKKLHEFPKYFKTIYDPKDGFFNKQEVKYYNITTKVYEDAVVLEKIDSDTYRISSNGKEIIVDESTLKALPEEGKEAYEKPKVFKRFKIKYLHNSDIQFSSKTIRKNEYIHSICLNNVNSYYLHQLLYDFFQSFINYCDSKNIEESEDTIMSPIGSVVSTDSSGSSGIFGDAFDDIDVSEPSVQVPSFFEITENILRNFERLKEYEPIYGEDEVNRYCPKIKHPRLLTDIEKYEIDEQKKTHSTQDFVKLTFNGKTYIFIQNCNKSIVEYINTQGIVYDSIFCNELQFNSNWYSCPKIWSNKEQSQVELTDLEYNLPHNIIKKYVELNGNQRDKDLIDDWVTEFYEAYDDEDFLDEDGKVQFKNKYMFLEKELFTDDKLTELDTKYRFQVYKNDTITSLEDFYKNLASDEIKAQLQKFIVDIQLYFEKIDWKHFYTEDEEKKPKQSVFENEEYQQFSPAIQDFLIKYKQNYIHIMHFEPVFNKERVEALEKQNSSVYINDHQEKKENIYPTFVNLKDINEYFPCCGQKTLHIEEGYQLPNVNLKVTKQYLTDNNDFSVTKQGSISKIPYQSSLNLFLHNPPYKFTKKNIKDETGFFIKGILPGPDNFLYAVADLYGKSIIEIKDYLLTITDKSFTQANKGNLEILFRHPYISSLQNFYEYVISDNKKDYTHFIDLLTKTNDLLPKQYSNKKLFLIMIQVHKIDDQTRFEVICPFYKRNKPTNDDNTIYSIMLINDNHFEPIYLHKDNQVIKFFTYQNNEDLCKSLYAILQNCYPITKKNANRFFFIDYTQNTSKNTLQEYTNTGIKSIQNPNIVFKNKENKKNLYILKKNKQGNLQLVNYLTGKTDTAKKKEKLLNLLEGGNLEETYNSDTIVLVGSGNAQLDTLVNTKYTKQVEELYKMKNLPNWRQIDNSTDFDSIIEEIDKYENPLYFTLNEEKTEITGFVYKKKQKKPYQIKFSNSVTINLKNKNNQYLLGYIRRKNSLLINQNEIDTKYLENKSFQDEAIKSINSLYKGRKKYNNFIQNINNKLDKETILKILQNDLLSDSDKYRQIKDELSTQLTQEEFPELTQKEFKEFVNMYSFELVKNFYYQLQLEKGINIFAEIDSYDTLLQENQVFFTEIDYNISLLNKLYGQGRIPKELEIIDFFY